MYIPEDSHLKVSVVADLSFPYDRSPTEATRLRFDQEKSRLHFNSWRVVIASWSRWWEKRHNELEVRPVGDCKVIFFSLSNRNRFA
jgi:hypothetical protein